MVKHLRVRKVREVQVEARPDLVDLLKLFLDHQLLLRAFDDFGHSVDARVQLQRQQVAEVELCLGFRVEGLGFRV